MDFTIATVSDVVIYLTSVMSGESLSACVVPVKNKTETSFSIVLKKPCEKERIKASLLLTSAIKLSSNSDFGDNSLVIVDDMSVGEFPALSSFNSCAVGTFSFSDEVSSILHYLSNVMFGVSSSSVMVNVKFDDTTTSEEVFKTPSEEERLKACEMLIDFYSSCTSSDAKLPTFVSGVFCE